MMIFLKRFAYYGYDAANARTYKLSMLNLNQWVNGQPQPLQLQLQSAMFYPNAYLTFNQNGNYTKHYYNGTERICSRLGDQTFSLDCSASLTPQTQQRLGTRIMHVDQDFRAELLELVEAGDVPVEFPNVLNLVTLLPAGSNANSHSHSNPNTGIFYYHTNHLGSTAFVTDANATVTQGFLYAPFGEITTEYAPLWQNGVMPKYAFNAKELDEETGMYYYEARYYAPPVFTSRDPLFEKKPWLSPYHYCSNNPVGRVDPSGQTDYDVETKNGTERKTIEDGFNGRIDVSKREFNKLERKYGRENGSYENYRDELKDKKGYTTGHPQGGIIFHQPKKTTTAKFGVKVSFGAQAGGKIQCGPIKIGLDGNINSIDILDGSVEKIWNKPLSTQGYIFNYEDIHGDRGFSVPLIVSYDYSYKARFEQVSSEKSVNSINILGYQHGSDGSSGFRISAGIKVLLGLEVYFECITK